MASEKRYTIFTELKNADKAKRDADLLDQSFVKLGGDVVKTGSSTQQATLQFQKLSQSQSTLAPSMKAVNTEITAQGTSLPKTVTATTNLNTAVATQKKNYDSLKPSQEAFNKNLGTMDQGLVKVTGSEKALTAPMREINTQLATQAQALPKTVTATNNMSGALSGMQKSYASVRGPADLYNKSLTTMEKTQTGMGSKIKSFGSNFGQLSTNMATLGGTVLNTKRQFDDLSDTQIKVDKTALKVSKTEEAVKAAQEKLNEAIKKSGANSAEAQKAQLDLNQANEAATLAVTMHGEALEDQGRAYENFWQGIVPTVTSAAGTIMSTVQTITGGKGLGGIKTAISGLSGLKLGSLTSLFSDVATGAPGAIRGILGIGTASGTAAVGVGGLKAALSGAAFALTTLVGIPLGGIFAGTELGKAFPKEFAPQVALLRLEYLKLAELLGATPEQVKGINDALNTLNKTFGMQTVTIGETTTATAAQNKATREASTYTLEHAEKTKEVTDAENAYNKALKDPALRSHQTEIAKAAQKTLDKAKADLDAAKAQSVSTAQLHEYGNTIAVLDPKTGQYTESLKATSEVTEEASGFTQDLAFTTKTLQQQIDNAASGTKTYTNLEDLKAQAIQNSIKAEQDQHDSMVAINLVRATSNQKLVAEHDALLASAIGYGHTADELKGLIETQGQGNQTIEQMNEKLRNLVKTDEDFHQSILDMKNSTSMFDSSITALNNSFDDGQGKFKNFINTTTEGSEEQKVYRDMLVKSATETYGIADATSMSTEELEKQIKAVIDSRNGLVDYNAKAEEFHQKILDMGTGVSMFVTGIKATNNSFTEGQGKFKDFINSTIKGAEVEKVYHDELVKAATETYHIAGATEMSTQELEDHIKKVIENKNALTDLQVVQKVHLDTITKEHDALVEDAIALGLTADQVQGLVNVEGKNADQIENINDLLVDQIEKYGKVDTTIFNITRTMDRLKTSMSFAIDQAESHRTALVDEARAAGVGEDVLSRFIDTRGQDADAINDENVVLRQLIIGRMQDTQAVIKQANSYDNLLTNQQEGVKAANDWYLGLIKSRDAGAAEEEQIRALANALGVDYNTAITAGIDNLKEFIEWNTDAEGAIKKVGDAVKTQLGKAFSIIDVDTWKEAKKKIKEFLKDIDLGKGSEKRIKLQLEADFKAKQFIDKAQKELLGITLEIKAGIPEGALDADIDRVIGEMKKALAKGADVQPFIDLLERIKGSESSAAAFTASMKTLTGINAQDILSDPQKFLETLKNLTPEQLNSLSTVATGITSSGTAASGAAEPLNKFQQEIKDIQDLNKVMNTHYIEGLNAMGNKTEEFRNFVGSRMKAVKDQVVSNLQEMNQKMNTHFIAGLNAAGNKSGEFYRVVKSNMDNTRLAIDKVTGAITTLKTQMDKLDGTKATVTVVHETVNTTVNRRHGGSHLYTGDGYQHGGAFINYYDTYFKGAHISEYNKPELVTVTPLSNPNILDDKRITVKTESQGTNFENMTRRIVNALENNSVFGHINANLFLNGQQVYNAMRPFQLRRLTTQL